MFKILNNRYLSSDVEASIELLQKQIQQIGQQTVADYYYYYYYYYYDHHHHHHHHHQFISC